MATVKLTISSIQLHQIEAGTVWANGKYKNDCPEWEKVEKAEAKAKKKRLGLWKNGKAIPPWDYRRRK